MKTFLFAVLAVAVSVPAYAKSVHVKSVGGWNIMEDVENERCAMAAKFGKNDDSVIFDYSARYDNYRAMVSNQNWKSLVDRARYKISIEMQGLKGMWTDEDALAINDGDGDPVLVIGGFDEDFGSELMTVNGITINDKDGDFLDAYSMKGTAVAVPEMVRCAVRLVREGKADPFEIIEPSKKAPSKVPAI